jgi:hypothetical protein
MTTQPPARRESNSNATDETERSARKGQRGFARGISGNPRGRPRGSVNKIQSLSQQLINDHAPEVIAKALELALEHDDIRAVKFLLDRLVPPKRSQPIFLDLPKTRTAKELLAAFGKVENSLRCGEITAEELRMVMLFLDAKRHVIEDVDLSERIAQLEARLEASS